MTANMTQDYTTNSNTPTIPTTHAGTIPYHPQELQNPLAAPYIPTYTHPGFQDPSGHPDPKIRDDFYGQRRKIRIGVLGAGISSINFLHFAEQNLQDYDIVVYERNEDVGGVVRLNPPNLPLKTPISRLTHHSSPTHSG